MISLSFFTIEQIIPLFLATIVLISSMLYFNFGKTKISLVLLSLGTLAIGFFIGNLDPFLVTWDEQFHALVAKSLLINPLMPKLYANPILEYDYTNWVNNHVWLHKQPLFLWQIAISLKLFGLNHLAVRFPSILMHAISTLMIFRIGKLTTNEKVGFYGALFFSVAYYPLELVAGKLNTDHNDVAFLFYILASFWAWFEYQQHQKKRYLILIGFFAGCAVLVKWLVGLLIFAVWFLTLGLNDKSNWLRLKAYQPLISSAIVSAMVFIPWQIYTLVKFPNEAKFEFDYNTRHFFEPLEGHSGDMWFHFRAFKDIYGAGDAIPFIYVIGLLIFLKKIKIRTFRYAILFAVLSIYLFYSIASTKMISFCIVVSPFLFLGLSSLVETILNYLNHKIRIKYFIQEFTPIILVVISYFILNLKKIQTNHTDWKPVFNYYRQADIDEMHFIKKLIAEIGTEHYVVFNSSLKGMGNIPIMFYTNHIAYNFIPSEEQISQIKAKKYNVAIWDNGALPNYILDNKDVVKIKSY